MTSHGIVEDVPGIYGDTVSSRRKLKLEKVAVKYCRLRGTTVVSVFLLAVTQCVYLW